MNKQEAEAILKRYLEGSATEEEEALLESWYLKHQYQELPVISGEEIQERLSKISAALPVTRKTPVSAVQRPLTRKITNWKKLAAAVFFIGLGTYLIVNHGFFSGQEPSTAALQEILPGGNRAVLKMANGEKVNLNEDKSGIITNGEQLVYADGSKIPGIENRSAVQNLNLSTPNGGQYQIVLSDGTKVWLNSASSLSYPSRFEGKERLVKITGEAYFEVAPLRSKPFRVESQGQVIEVLGTHFNVDAYADEAFTKTTLLQGKVKVTLRQKETILHPGQQLQFSAKESHLINDPDLEEITAWKDGYFKFSESLESIMTKVARWYDIEVVYQGNFDGKLKFLGKISRSKNLSSILDIISSASNVHFKVEGRRVTVMK